MSDQTLPADFDPTNRYDFDIDNKDVVSFLLKQRFTRAQALNVIAYLAIFSSPPLTNDEIQTAIKAVSSI